MTASAAEVTQLAFPSFPGTKWITTSPNTLYCARWIATADRTGATRLTIQNDGGSATRPTVSGALYVDADAGAKLVSGTASFGLFADPSPVTGTAAAFNIVAGTRYRLCVCADDSTSIMAVFTDDAASAVMKLPAFLNAGAAGVVVGTAANPCTGAAVPPATTGVLTAADIKPPIGVIE